MSGGDLEAMESRIGGMSDAAANYKNLMTSGLLAQQKFGQSRLRGSGGGLGADSLNNLWYQYGSGSQANYGQVGQGSFASRKGGLGAGSSGVLGGSNSGNAGANGGGQYPSYDYDYDDYGNINMANLGGAANRRFGSYDTYLDYGGLSRGYGGGSGAVGGSGLGAGYGLSGGGYSPVSVVSGYGPSVCEDKGLNPALVLATLAGAALAFFIIYRQITSGGKRNLSPTPNEFVDHVANLVWSGKFFCV